MKRIFFLLLIILLLASCEEMLLGKDEPDTPEHNFDMLWNDFDKHYSLFYIKKTNWDSLYRVYRPQVNANTDEPTLWKIMTEMIEVLNDSHTVLYNDQEARRYPSGYTLNQIAIEEEFDLNLITSKYTGPLKQMKSEEDLYYGKMMNQDVGYILLRKTLGEQPEKAMEKIMSELSNRKAIILDLRTNAGGSAFYAKTIAGVFADGKHVVGTVQLRNGPKHSDFGEKTDEVTTLTGATQFLKPVVVLTDRATMSGGEYLALHMKSFGHVTHIGDTTAGDFGATSGRRFLPNGWTYTFSIKMFLLPNGKSLDGIGIPPDIYVKNTDSSIYGSTDRVLEKAIRYLYDEYGIE